MKIRNCDDLIKYINKGNKVKYVFFWGHQKPVEGISKSCFSQWYESSFIVNEITYLTAEHYMMAEKARLFSDDATASKIVEATNPDAAKKFGREVIGFEEDLWIKNRFNIVAKGNLAKFKQNAEIRKFLHNTKKEFWLRLVQLIRFGESDFLQIILQLKIPQHGKV